MISKIAPFRQFNGFPSKGGVASGTERFTDGGVASKLGETERGLSRAYSEGRTVHLRTLQVKHNEND